MAEELTVVSQQIENEGKFAFRKWNPEKLKDEDNNPDLSVSCPVACICCFLVEGLFKIAFEETIDLVFEQKGMDCDEIFEDMEETN